MNRILSLLFSSTVVAGYLLIFNLFIACGKRELEITHLPPPPPSSPEQTSPATPTESIPQGNSKGTQNPLPPKLVQSWFVPQVQGKAGVVRWQSAEGNVEIVLDTFLENAPLLPLKKIILAQSFYRHDFNLLAKNFPIGLMHLHTDATLRSQWQKKWQTQKPQPASGHIHIEVTVNPGDRELIAAKDAPLLLSLYRYNPRLQTFQFLAADYLKDGYLNPYVGKITNNETYYFDAKNIKTEELRQLLENQDQLFFAWKDLDVFNQPTKEKDNVMGFCFQNHRQVNCFNISKTLTAEELIKRLTSDYQLITPEQLAKIGESDQPQGKWNFWQPATQEEKEMDQWLFGTKDQLINNYQQKLESFPFVFLIHTNYLELMQKLSFQLQKEDNIALTNAAAACLPPPLGKVHLLITGNKKVPLFQENILRSIVTSLTVMKRMGGMPEDLQSDTIYLNYQGAYTDFSQWQSLPLLATDVQLIANGMPQPWELNKWMTFDQLLAITQPITVKLIPSPSVEKSIGFQRWEGKSPGKKEVIHTGSLHHEVKSYPIELQGQVKCQFFTRL